MSWLVAFVVITGVLAAGLYVLNSYVVHNGGPEAGKWEPIAFAAVASAVITPWLAGVARIFFGV